jgi:dipeptidyl aminopeptidase/acylaminoacyl peptidase
MALLGGPTFTEAGLHCLVLDGPGQGAPLRFENLYTRPDYEVVYGAALDYLATRPECDTDRAGVVGISMGGYYGARGALDLRAKAAVVWSALYDVGEGLYDYFPPIRDTLRYITGSRSPEDARERLRAYTLAPVIERIRCPTLVVHGAADHLVPESEARRIYDGLTGEKGLRIWPDGQHVSLDYYPEATEAINEWMLRHLTH